MSETQDDRIEQAKIKVAISKVIPIDVRYRNLVIALSEMLAKYARRELDEDKK